MKKQILELAGQFRKSIPKNKRQLIEVDYGRRLIVNPTDTQKHSEKVAWIVKSLQKPLSDLIDQSPRKELTERIQDVFRYIHEAKTPPSEDNICNMSGDSVLPSSFVASPIKVSKMARQTGYLFVGDLTPQGEDKSYLDLLLDEVEGTRKPPLGETATLVYEKLKSLPEHKAMTAPELADWLAKQEDYIISESTIRKDIIPQLQPYGIKNKKRIGYYI